MQKMAEIIIILIPLLYAGVLTLFWAGLFRPRRGLSKDRPKVTVVIAARNEEKDLPLLLEDLEKQTYPRDILEIIIANDHSEDQTGQIIDSFSRKDSRFIHVPVTLYEPGFTAKKNALTQALRQASGEIILTTDADCRVHPAWVETMASFFTPDTGLVAGFSQLSDPEKHESLFEKLQAVDFLMLMGAAQGSANWDHGLAASGQNLAYRKKVYDEVGGFQRIGRRISGDDVLFLQLVRKMTRWKVRFASSETAYNRTRAESSFRAFVHQRRRWASNAAYQWRLNKPFFMYVITTFLTNLILLISLPTVMLMPALVPGFLAAWIVKALSENLLFSRSCRIYRRSDLYSAFLLWFLCQIPYVVIVGLTGTLGGFTWKGREHRSPEQK
jgi:cellulose synthase/poly-beta-1,6-N-acetylglucosamine synthase-like glycosyltransferase